jgi:hypothetical protein
LVLSVLPVSALQAAAGWTGFGRVVELQATIHGRFIFRLDISSNPTDCKNKEWFYRDNRGVGSNQIYLTLLEAVTSGQQVRVYVTGICDLNGYSEISSVSVSG